MPLAFPRARRDGCAGEELHDPGFLLRLARSRIMSRPGRARLREEGLIFRVGRHGEAAFLAQLPSWRLDGQVIRHHRPSLSASLCHCLLLLFLSCAEIRVLGVGMGEDVTGKRLPCVSRPARLFEGVYSNRCVSASVLSLCCCSGLSPASPSEPMSSLRSRGRVGGRLSLD